jgi:hypothetical protein
MRVAALLGALALGLDALTSGTVATDVHCFVSSPLGQPLRAGPLGPPICKRQLVSTVSSMAMAAKTKKPAKKKSAAPSAGGFASKTATVTKTVDAATLLRKSMDLYDMMSKEEALRESSVDDDAEDEPGLREYVVCVRSKEYDAVSDWVPAACMGVMWSGGQVEDNPILKGIADHNLFAPIAAKLHCREVWESACQSAPSLRKLPRNSIEYAFEPLDTFGDVIEVVDGKGASTANALKTLGVSKGASAADIKAAHRKLIMTLHPDRVASLPEEEQDAARKRFEQVQEAYEVLGGGSGDSISSWYESLGSGRADFFSGPIDLRKPVDGGLLEYWTAAVCPLDMELTNKFITRNVLRSMA